MSGPGRRFDPSELRTSGEPGHTQPSDAELAEAFVVARELEELSAVDGIRPTEGFEDRVMAAIATEPAPRLVVRPASVVRGGRLAVLLLAIRDAWGVATSGGRPMAVRAQALAFVLLVVLAAGALTTATAVTVGGFLQRNDDPSPSVAPAPSLAPTSSGPVVPTMEPTPTSSAAPSGSPEPTETSEATETPGAGETEKPRITPRPTRTPRPTDTAEPTETPDPDDTPEPTETDGGGGSGGGGSGHG